jgi:hypothetical protein
MEVGQLVKVCAAAYLVVILLDLVRSRDTKRFLLEFLPLVLLTIIDVLLASAHAGYLTFGPGASPAVTILIMLGSILLGTVARYIFSLQGKFVWLDFAKPLCISPILLLPLMSSVQTLKSLEPVQVLSFALLAFQNGFFWQAVLGRARPKDS